MLKWTIQKRPIESSGLHPSLSSLRPLNEANRIRSRRSLDNLSRPNRKHNSSQEYRRITLGSHELLKSIRYDDKENPQPTTLQHFRNNAGSTPASCYAKLDFALRNKTPKSGSALQQLNNNITPNRKRPLPQTPPSSPNISPIRDVRSRIPSTPYASTLPTFELEYSPCGTDVQAIPTDMSGLTVSDGFFNHPRYFNDNFSSIPSKRLKTTSSTARSSSILANFTLDKRNVENDLGNCNDNKTVRYAKASEVEISVNSKRVNDDNCNLNSISTNQVNNAVDSNFKTNAVEESLSSSALDDTALDKMIDAILESARKEKPYFARNLVGRKALAFRTSFRRISSDSPTYTAADDPASDLSKFNGDFVISPQKLLEAGERTIILDDDNVVNEREVRTPKVLETNSTLVSSNESNCHLKRQRAVRRKHNAKSDVLQSWNNKHEKNNSVKDKKPTIETEHITPTKENFTYDSFLKKNIDELAEMITPIVDKDQGKEVENGSQCNGAMSTTSKLPHESTPIIYATDLKASSTPTDAFQPMITSIRRCLSYSNLPLLEYSADNSMERRKSIASWTASSSIESFTGNRCNIGTVDLAIFSECSKLHIHGELLVRSTKEKVYFFVFVTRTK